MPQSRSRSRSRRRDDRDHDRDRREEKKDDPPPRKEAPADTGKSGSSEQEIVSVAIKQLPGDIRERLQKLFEEGLLKEGDLDLRSITVFASLNEGLQARVMNHMENERIYVANARSKSGFLIATCDKAKTGCLDARGLGAIDPWRTALVAMATPKQKMLDLKPERDWLDQHESDGDIKVNVNVQAVESELGVPTVTLEVPLSETAAAVKAKLVAMGVKSIPANRMKLHTDPVGFLKERYTFAYYNLKAGVTLALSERKRAGVRFRADHTAMPKRPKAQPQSGEASAAPADALQKLVNSAPKLPALPALPKLPGLPSPSTMPALPAPGTTPGLPMSLLPGGGTGPGGLAPRLQGSAPGGLNSLLGSSGARPPLPGGLQLPGAGASGNLMLPKLLDAKAAGMPLGLPSMTGPEKPGMTPPAFPGLSMGGPGMPKVAGGLPFSMPGLGPLTKAPAGIPAGVGGLLAGAPMPMDVAGPKVQSQAPPGMTGTIPKMPGLPLTGLGGGAQQPLASAAVAAATAKGPPPG